ncbi:hypothetical protein BV25DRAFT_50702 [Artomyces pyxidatus]|uniref:Uncharacterized protein n=1 Tax=Artomyces pyxidatus TaxID=48021 RepID=A0ACB8TKD1_9AGAM|nr:hypothetical protein BV25DRAFT_50702 [Artomyces pyxidatus]
MIYNKDYIPPYMPRVVQPRNLAIATSLMEPEHATSAIDRRRISELSGVIHVQNTPFKNGRIEAEEIDIQPTRHF